MGKINISKKPNKINSDFPDEEQIFPINSTSDSSSNLTQSNNKIKANPLKAKIASKSIENHSLTYSNESSSSESSSSSSSESSSNDSENEYQNQKKRKKKSFNKKSKKKKKSIGNCTLITETISTVESKIWICPACKNLDDGSAMIGCDNCDDWYHWDCVGITVEPKDEEAWYCTTCTEIKQKNKKKKKK